MFLRCPHGGGADVELAVETVADGDGVWAQSGLAVVVVRVDARGDPTCENGCPLTGVQLVALERRAVAVDTLGLEAEQREAAEAHAELAGDAWWNR